MVAAQEIGCPPWELEEQPSYWRDRALIKRNAEISAKQQQRSLQEQMEANRR